MFGVRTQDVQQLLADRDATAVAAGDQVRAAEDRAKAFEARAASLEAQLAEVTEAQAARQREVTDSTDPHTLLLAVREEMARVMHATQEAGSRILDFARSDVEHQLDDVDRRRNEINEDRERLTAWVAQFQDSAGGLRESIVDAAGFIHRTMSTMEDAERAMARVVGRMAEADAVLQKFQQQPEGLAPQGASASAVEHGPSVELVREPAAAAIANGNGNGNGNGAVYPAPAPPVAVASPLAASDAGAADEDDNPRAPDEVTVVPATSSQPGENDPGSTGQPLAPTWAAGPAGRRSQVGED
jgi:predicted  nucleic acid-binding Zn-ribbon protein